MVTILRYTFFLYLVLWSLLNLFVQKVLALNFSETYFFGDSLSDKGNFIGTGNRRPPNIPPAPLTNNNGPIWSDYIATLFGTHDIARDFVRLGPNTPPNSTNYALVGATANQNIQFSTISVGVETILLLVDKGILPDALLHAHPFPTSNQLSQMVLKSPKRLDDKALYFTWIGANDIVLGSTQIRNSTISLNDISDSILKQLQFLRLAGAQNIVLINLPDLRRVPRKNITDPQNASVLNQILLTTLRNTNFPVLMIDIESMVNEVLDYPQSFGFTDTTQGGVFIRGSNGIQISGNSPINGTGQPQDFIGKVFYDGFHPTAAAHKVIGNFVNSFLLAPNYITTFVDGPQGIIQTLQQGLIQALPPIYSIKNRITPFLQLHTGPFIGPNFSQNKYESTPTLITLGVTNNLARYFTLGFSLSGYNDCVKGLNPTSSFSIQGVTGSLLAGFSYHRFFLNSTIQLGKTYYKNMERSFYFGPKYTTALGNMSGAYVNTSIQGGFNIFQSPFFTSGPFTEFQHQKISTEDFTESNARSARIHYYAQQSETIFSGLGWHMNLQLLDTNYGGFSANASFSTHTRYSSPRFLQFNPATLPGTKARFILKPPDTNFHSARFHLSYTSLKQKVTTMFGYLLNHGDKNQFQHMVKLDVHIPVA